MEERRENRRYRHAGEIGVSVIGDSIGRGMRAIAAIDLSASGISFLNRWEVEPGIHVRVSLSRLDDGSDGFEGESVACSPVGDESSKIGIKFNDPIKIEDFVELRTEPIPSAVRPTSPRRRKTPQ